VADKKSSATKVHLSATKFYVLQHYSWCYRLTYWSENQHNNFKRW